MRKRKKRRVSDSYLNQRSISQKQTAREEDSSERRVQFRLQCVWSTTLMSCHVSIRFGLLAYLFLFFK